MQFHRHLSDLGWKIQYGSKYLHLTPSMYLPYSIRTKNCIEYEQSASKRFTNHRLNWQSYLSISKVQNVSTSISTIKTAAVAALLTINNYNISNKHAKSMVLQNKNKLSVCRRRYTEERENISIKNYYFKYINYNWLLT